MKKLIRAFYRFKFFDDLVLIYPLYSVMFVDYGMQAWQVSALLLAWSLTSFILEIPSGVWADKYSRKHILILGQMIRAIGYLCWLLFPTFYGFLFGFIFWGIKSALTSGTLQALVYDELKYHRQEKQFTKIWGRMQTLSFVAILMASFLASPAILWGYPFVLGISAAAVGLSGLSIMGYSLKSPSLSRQKAPYFSVLRLGFRNAVKDRYIFRLILFMAIVIALNGGLDEYWPIFAKEVGVPNYALGMVFGIMSIGEALGSYYAHYFEKRNIRFIYWLTLVNGLLLWLASYIYQWPSLVLLLLFSVVFSVMQVILEGQLHHAMAEDTRATVSSISGFLTEWMVMGVFGGFGLLSQWGDYRLGFLSFGVLIMLVSLFYLSFSWTIQRSGASNF